jgi:pimeloyl-ACP methyl ester carboxylesterase
MLEDFAYYSLYPVPEVPFLSPPPAPLEEVWLFLSTGDSIVGWWYSDPLLSAHAPLVLFFHGNGENLETMRQAKLYQNLDTLGVGFLAVEYPGYGLSSGRASEEALMAAGDAALSWARTRYPQRPVILCGWSLGAAVAIGTAARHPEEIRALIALSPWTSLHDVAAVHFPERLTRALVEERYDSLEAARHIQVPTLVVHGDVDTLIPIPQGRRIAEALAGRKRWVPLPGAGHNDLLRRSEVWDEIASFLRAL